MKSKDVVIIPYKKSLTVTAAVLCALAITILVTAIASGLLLLLLVSAALLLTSASLMIQNRRVTLSGKNICIKHFLGIIKAQSFEVAECGLFVSDPAPGNRTYIDKRALHRDVTPEDKLYVYMSEYILSKQEQEGSQFSLGEPILIFEYTAELYSTLSVVFPFNCDPF